MFEQYDILHVIALCMKYLLLGCLHDDTCYTCRRVNPPKQRRCSFLTFLVHLILWNFVTCQECPTAQCPDAWITFRDSCYYLSDNVSVDWIEATVSIEYI